MDFTEAVSLALAGEQRGFNILYEKTYRKKYFLALQYMKNEAAAEDVMQEAYIRAFSKLDTLENPEKFPGWLGMIVANTAKNSLKKNRPMLFSDFAADDGQEMFEYQIEDDNIEHMPEMAYTREETRQLAHELLDSLSEEQRTCMLMFYIEGLSVKEIASGLECSENTVKSRLKYGRDNIKGKGEELKKKGYQLYSVAPLPLLVYFLQQEESYLEADGSLASAGVRIAECVMPSFGSKSGTGGFGGFLHTVAGKVAVAVIALCITGGAVTYGVSLMNRDGHAVESKVEDEDSAVPREEDDVTEIKKEEETPPAAAKGIQNSEYETLIAGNLTKEELKFVLAYGPLEIPEQGFTNNDYLFILNSLCDASNMYMGGLMIEYYGPDAEWRGHYSLADVNRLFRSFTDYQLAEGDGVLDGYSNLQVQNDAVIFSGSSISRTSNVEIVSGSYTEEEMELFYTYVYTTLDIVEDGLAGILEYKRAVLRPNAEGLYQIVEIEVLEKQELEEPVEEETPAEETVSFPEGSYSFVAETGGYRGGFSIDSAGVATYREVSGGTGAGVEYKYQMVVDDSAFVPEGVTAYILYFFEGNKFQLTDNGSEITGIVENADDLILYYDPSQNTLMDPEGGKWELTM